MTVKSVRISFPSSVRGSQYAPAQPLSASIGSNRHFGVLTQTEKISAWSAGHGLKLLRRNCRRQTSKIGSRMVRPSLLCHRGQLQSSPKHRLSSGKSETSQRIGALQKSAHSPWSSSLYTMILKDTTSGVSTQTRAAPVAFSTRPLPTCTKTASARTGS